MVLLIIADVVFMCLAIDYLQYRDNGNDLVFYFMLAVYMGTVLLLPTLVYLLAGTL